MSLNISKQQVFFLGIAYRYRRKSLSTIIWEFYGCGKLAFCKTARKLQGNIVANSLNAHILGLMSMVKIKVILWAIFYVFHVFLNLIFKAAMLHELPKCVKMQEKHDFMTCSDVNPAKWYMIQHSTEFGQVL